MCYFKNINKAFFVEEHAPLLLASIASTLAKHSASSSLLDLICRHACKPAVLQREKSQIAQHMAVLVTRKQYVTSHLPDTSTSSMKATCTGGCISSVRCEEQTAVTAADPARGSVARCQARPVCAPCGSLRLYFTEYLFTEL
jgi:hypothetical protein